MRNLAIVSLQSRLCSQPQSGELQLRRDILFIGCFLSAQAEANAGNPLRRAVLYTTEWWE